MKSLHLALAALKAGNLGCSFFKWSHKCLVLQPGKTELLILPYQITLKITGETPSLYLSKEFKQVCKSFQNKQTKYQQQVCSQLQLLSADCKPRVFLGASLALCNNCLNTPLLLTEEGQQEKQQEK